MRRFVAALAVMALGGCSLGIQGPAKHASLAETPKCDTGRGAVFADGVFGTGFGIGGIAGLANDESGLGLTSLVFGGLLIAAAVHGNGQASACQRAIVEHDQYVAGLRDRDDERAQVADDAPADDDGPVPMLPTPAVAAKALVAGDKPVVAQPAAQPAPAPQPEPEAQPDTDEWSAFWEAAP